MGLKWLTVVSVLVMSLGLPQLSFAQTEAPLDDLGDGEYQQKPFGYYDNTVRDNTRLGGYDDVASEGPVVTAGRVINFLLLLLGTLALCLCVYAGFLWMIARGDEEDIKKAKDILIGTTVGIVVVLSSYTFMAYVFNAFTEATDASTPKLIVGD